MTVEDRMAKLPYDPVTPNTVERRGPARRFLAWVDAYLFQAYIGVAFIFIGIIVRPPYDPAFVAEPFWPWIFMAVGLASFASIWRPFEGRLSAHVGASIVVLSGMRGIAAASIWWASGGEQKSALVATFLWGLGVIIGLSWARLTFTASMRRVISEGRERCD